MKHHILTTGISLISNFSNTHSPRLSNEDAVKQHTKLASLLDDDPHKASAELNSLFARLDGNEPSQLSELSVTLIHTETETGKCVCSLLENWLKPRVAQVYKIPVKGFDKPAKDFTPEFAQSEAHAALIQLRQSVSTHIGKLRAQTPCPEIELNCTGGYKAEAAVLYALGKELCVPVYYLHDTFKTCVTLP
jgi:putative CRISPR-associated protein (TIGR02619 family)